LSHAGNRGCQHNRYKRFQVHHLQLSVYGFSGIVGSFLDARVNWVYLPLILYALASMAAMTLKPQAAASSLWWRLGIYVGAVLNIQYSLSAILATLGLVYDPAPTVIGYCFLFLLFVVMLAAATWAAMCWLSRWIKRWGTNSAGRCIAEAVAVLATLIVILTLVGMIVTGVDLVAPYAVLRWPMAGGICMALTGAALWPLMAFCHVARKLWCHVPPAENPMGKEVLIVTGLYGASTTAAVIAAIHHFSNLPAHSPSFCYLASAAARGHRRIERDRNQ